MSSDGCPVLNPQESEEFIKRLRETVRYLTKFEVNYDAYTRKPDKERAKLICAMIKQDEQRILNTYQGTSWLYYRNFGGQYGRRNNFI